MKLGRILKHEIAKQSLEEIAGYLAREMNLETGLRFLDRAEETFSLLLTMPEGGWKPAFQSPQLRDLRKWPVRGFERWLVYYKHVEEGVEVVDVLHGSLDPDRRVAEKLAGLV